MRAARIDVRRDRVGLVVGGTTGGMLETEQLLAQAPRRARVPRGAGRDALASADGDGGPAGRAPRARSRAIRTLSSACSSGANALVVAAAWLLAGEVDAVVAGASDGLCRLTLGGFNALGAIDPEPCRPFDRAAPRDEPRRGRGLPRARARGVARGPAGCRPSPSSRDGRSAPRRTTSRTPRRTAWSSPRSSRAPSRGPASRRATWTTSTPTAPARRSTTPMEAAAHRARSRRRKPRASPCRAARRRSDTRSAPPVPSRRPSRRSSWRAARSCPPRASTSPIPRLPLVHVPARRSRGPARACGRLERLRLRRHGHGARLRRPGARSGQRRRPIAPRRSRCPSSRRLRLSSGRAGWSAPRRARTSSSARCDPGAPGRPRRARRPDAGPTPRPGGPPRRPSRCSARSAEAGGPAERDGARSRQRVRKRRRLARPSCTESSRRARAPRARRSFPNLVPSSPVGHVVDLPGPARPGVRDGGSRSERRERVRAGGAARRGGRGGAHRRRRGRAEERHRRARARGAVRPGASQAAASTGRPGGGRRASRARPRQRRERGARVWRASVRRSSGAAIAASLEGLVAPRSAGSEVVLARGQRRASARCWRDAVGARARAVACARGAGGERRAGRGGHRRRGRRASRRGARRTRSCWASRGAAATRSSSRAREGARVGVEARSIGARSSVASHPSLQVSSARACAQPPPWHGATPETGPLLRAAARGRARRDAREPLGGRGGDHAPRAAQRPRS